MGLVCDNCGSTDYQDSWCEGCRSTHFASLRQELAEARAENERLLNVVRSVEAKADGHYEGRHKAGPDDWLWVRAMCRDVMKEKE